MCPEIDKHEFHWRIIPLEGLAGHYLVQKYFLTQRQENTWLVLAISCLWVKFDINLPLLFFKILSHPFLHEFVAGIRDQHFFLFLELQTCFWNFWKLSSEAKEILKWIIKTRLIYPKTVMNMINSGVGSSARNSKECH